MGDKKKREKSKDQVRSERGKQKSHRKREKEKKSPRHSDKENKVKDKHKDKKEKKDKKDKKDKKEKIIKVIGKYNCYKKLGSGSYSTVYKVKKIDGDDKFYAMKVITMDDTLSPTEKKNILNEVRLLSGIHHPNIIRYKKSFVHKEQFCVVMEYSDSGDLAGVITKYKSVGKFIAEEDIWMMILQVIRGINALHHNNIMHRDIKPENIFVFSNGEIKLGDFNVAKFKRKGKNLGETQTGTPFYTPPEIWGGAKHDTKIDIWAIGCLLYELSALKSPFEGETMYDLMDHIIEGTYDPIPPYYTKEISELVKILLAKDPDSRPTCDQLLKLPALSKVNEVLTSKFPEVLKHDLDYLNGDNISITSSIEYDDDPKQLNKNLKKIRPKSKKYQRPLTPVKIARKPKKLFVNEDEYARKQAIYRIMRLEADVVQKKTLLGKLEDDSRIRPYGWNKDYDLYEVQQRMFDKHNVPFNQDFSPIQRRTRKVKTTGIRERTDMPINSLLEKYRRKKNKVNRNRFRINPRKDSILANSRSGFLNFGKQKKTFLSLNSPPKLVGKQQMNNFNSIKLSHSTSRTQPLTTFDSIRDVYSKKHHYLANTKASYHTQKTKRKKPLFRKIYRSKYEKSNNRARRKNSIINLL